MPSSVANEVVRSGDRIAHGVKRNLFWLLVGCYALAALLPGPGLTLRAWNLSSTALAGVRLSPSLLLLALLLFCAAILTELKQLRGVLHYPGTLVLSLVGVWLGPALLVVVAGWILPWVVEGRASAGLLVGLALVAAMPVANSSIGWVQHAGGNLALGLALVVLSITISPWMTPRLLELFGASLSAEDQALCQALVDEFSGDFFIVWVLLPTLTGLVARYVVGAERVGGARGWITLVSAAALLLLNYINSSLALPKIPQTSPLLLAITLALAFALSLVGLASGWALTRLLRLMPETESTLLFGLSMKHTGLALILAGAVLVGQPLAILIIVLATLVQHFVVGIVQWLRIDGGRV